VYAVTVMTPTAPEAHRAPSLCYSPVVDGGSSAHDKRRPEAALRWVLMSPPDP
jgi:hypothetical protein